jgi:hypothetical protein
MFTTFAESCPGTRAPGAPAPPRKRLFAWITHRGAPNRGEADASSADTRPARREAHRVIAQLRAGHSAARQPGMAGGTRYPFATFVDDKYA